MATWETVSTSRLHQQNGGTGGFSVLWPSDSHEGCCLIQPAPRCWQTTLSAHGWCSWRLFEVSPHPKTRHFLSFQTKRCMHLLPCTSFLPFETLLARFSSHSQSSCVSFKCLTPDCNASHCFKPLTRISSFPKDAVSSHKVLHVCLQVDSRRDGFVCHWLTGS